MDRALATICIELYEKPVFPPRRQTCGAAICRQKSIRNKTRYQTSCDTSRCILTGVRRSLKVPEWTSTVLFEWTTWRSERGPLPAKPKGRQHRHLGTGMRGGEAHPRKQTRMTKLPPRLNTLRWPCLMVGDSLQPGEIISNALVQACLQAFKGPNLKKSTRWRTSCRQSNSSRCCIMYSSV
jgi:hypothetical protein